MSTTQFSVGGQRTIVTGASSGIGRAVPLGETVMGASYTPAHHKR
jgi:NADP-dependent 3-hydroxy acid dehydrogenase YdfG